jgi:integrase
VRVTEADKQERDDFTDDDLGILASSPLYAGCVSERQRHVAGPLCIQDASYWLPLLALYHGARLEELGQMLPDDVRSVRVRLDDGSEKEIHVLAIDTREEDDPSDKQPRRRGKSSGQAKRLKTRPSKRLVPIHPVLITTGFLKYVDAARAAGRVRLHHTLKVDGYGRTTKKWSQWFGRYLTKIGLARPALTFHSTRHTFKTACRRARIPRDVSHAISGYASSDVGDGYGEYPLDLLASEISKVSYPVLERTLHHLR